MELGNNRDLSGETINIACGSVVYQRKDDKVILVTATPSALKMVGHEGKLFLYHPLLSSHSFLLTYV